MDAHRALSLRQHRVIGNFCALYAWKNNVDCIGLNRVALSKILNIETYKGARLKLLEEDIKAWFPYFQSLKTPSGTFSSIYLSRVPFKRDVFIKKMDINKRIQLLNSQDIRSKELRPDEMPSESVIISNLALIANGLSSLTEL